MSPMPLSELEQWTPSDVAKWCTAKLATRFPGTLFEEMLANMEKVHLIDGLLLMQLDDSDWREAVPSIGARKTLMNEVRSLLPCSANLRRDPPTDCVAACRTLLSQTSLDSVRLAKSADLCDRFAKPDDPCDTKAVSPSGSSRSISPLPSHERSSPDDPRRRRLSLGNGTTRFINARLNSGVTKPAARTRGHSATLKQRKSGPGAGPALPTIPGVPVVTSFHGRRNAKAHVRYKRAESDPVPQWSAEAPVPRASDAQSLDCPSDIKLDLADSHGPRAEAPDPRAAAPSPHCEADGAAVPPLPDPAPPRDARAAGERDSGGLEPPAGLSVAPLSRLGGGSLGLLPTARHIAAARRRRSMVAFADVPPSASPESSSSPRVVDVLKSKQTVYGVDQSHLLLPSGTMSTRPSGFALPKGRAWFKVFLEPSNFSNLPIVAHHTRHNLPTAPMTWYEALNVHVAYAVCKVVVLCQTIARTLRLWQVLWCLLGCLCTWLFRHWHMTADIPFTIHISLLIFPLAFCVNAGYQRREGALSYSAQFKANCLTLYLHHRCFQFEEQVPHDFIQCSCSAFTSLFEAVRMYLTASTEESKVYDLQCVYDIFSEISLVNDVLRISGLPAPMVAALSTNMREIIVAFESLRTFCDYRTPSSVRCFIYLAVVLSPVLLIPSWAALAFTTSPENEWMVYAATFLTPLWLMFLLNTQTSLENPFYGVDGIRLDALQMVEYMADTELMQTTNDGKGFASSSFCSSGDDDEDGDVDDDGDLDTDLQAMPPPPPLPSILKHSSSSNHHQDGS